MCVLMIFASHASSTISCFFQAEYGIRDRTVTGVQTCALPIFEHEGRIWLCVTRKTLTKVSKTAIVVGDRVRFRESGTKDELGRPEAVIEQVLPRQTILTRAASFKGIDQHPIVANAEQMLIVASVLQPRPKWGLVDRMLVAAQSGGLK